MGSDGHEEGIVWVEKGRTTSRSMVLKPKLLVDIWISSAIYIPEIALGSAGQR